MNSFKSPPMSPMGLVLSFARALGIVSTVDDVVIVPLSQWHAMHERHEADQAALRSALARLIEVEATVSRLTTIVDDWHTVVKAVGRDPGTEHETGRALDDILDAERTLHGYAPDLSIDEAAARLSEALRSALARVVEVEARADRHEAARHALEETAIREKARADQNERDRRDAVARWQEAEAAERRLTAELATARGQS